MQFVLGFLLRVPKIHWDVSGVQITGTLDPVVKRCYWKQDGQGYIESCTWMLSGSGVLFVGCLSLRPFQKSKPKVFFFQFQGYLFSFSYLFLMFKMLASIHLYHFLPKMMKVTKKRRYRSLSLSFYLLLSNPSPSFSSLKPLIHFLISPSVLLWWRHRGRWIQRIPC